MNEQQPHNSVPETSFDGDKTVCYSHQRHGAGQQSQHSVSPSFGQSMSNKMPNAGIQTTTSRARGLNGRPFTPDSRMAAGQSVPHVLPQISLAQAQTIAEKRTEWSKDQFMRFIEPLVTQDRWIAGRIYHTDVEVTKSTFNQLREDSNHVIELKRFIQLNPQLTYEYNMTDINLRATFGIRPLKDIINFIELFVRVGMKGRSYLSPVQPDATGIFKIAQSPLAQLPKSTIKAIVRYNLDKFHQILETCPEDLATLIPSVKAWSVCPDLPRAIAEKIGDLPSIDRMAAAIAWNETVMLETDQAIEMNMTDTDLIEKFWSSYSVIEKLGTFGILVRYSDQVIDHSGCQRIVQELFPAWSRDEQRTLAKELAATFVNTENRRTNLAEVLRDLNVGVWKKARRSLPSDMAFKAALIFRDVATYESACTKFGVTELFRIGGNSIKEQLQPIEASKTAQEKVHCYFTAVQSRHAQIRVVPNS